MLNVKSIRIVNPALREPGIDRGRLLAVLPLYQEDAALGPPMKALWEKKYANAWYYCLGNLMLFRLPISKSCLEAGATLLHEAGHALHAFEEGRIGTEGEVLTERHLEEEVKAHTQDHRLWSEIGGSAYSDAVTKALYWIAKRFRQAHSNWKFCPLKSDGPWSKALDSMFGEAAHEADRNARVFCFSIHVHFEYADRQRAWSSEKKAQYKRQTMHLIYTQFAPGVTDPLEF